MKATHVMVGGSVWSIHLWKDQCIKYGGYGVCVREEGGLLHRDMGAPTIAEGMSLQGHKVCIQK